MPRVAGRYSHHSSSIRQQAVDCLELFIREALTSLGRPPPPTEWPSSLKEALVIHAYLTSTRYIYPNPTIVRPSSAVYRDERLSILSPIDFKRELRVTPEQFNFIISQIEHHPVFHNHGRKPQKDVIIQLKVALSRLGHDGSASSFASIASRLDVATGSVVRYTTRCIIALSSLRSRFVKWPNGDEKRAIKSRFLEAYHFDTIGAIDGTMIDLWKAPELDGDAWSTRKHSFSMGATAVCDDNSVFIFFSTAYLGRTHDAAAFRNSDLCLRENEFFTGDDYLLADAAYPLTSRIIPRFKGANLTKQQHRFNRLHGKARARIEHSFGMLKGKWQSLLHLRCNIADGRDIWKVATLIMACVVLHNITRMEGLYDPADQDIPLVPMLRLPGNAPGGGRIEGRTRRDAIMADVLRRAQQ